MASRCCSCTPRTSAARSSKSRRRDGQKNAARRGHREPHCAAYGMGMSREDQYGCLAW
jgi:hypothetical protein